MPLGGFKTVDLNLAGWAALLGPGVVVGAGVGFALDGVPVLPAVAAGAVVAFGLGRLVDEVSDRRRWQWVAVTSGPDVRNRLHDSGITVLGETTADVRGRAVTFVAVRARDAPRTEAEAGLPRESRRAARRSRHARMVALGLTPPPGRRRR